MDHAVNVINEIDFEENGIHRNAPRVRRVNVDGFNISELDFRRYFRLSKPLARYVIEAIRPQFPILRTSSLAVERKVCI